MEKDKRCVDLVQERFEDRLATIKKAMENLFDGKEPDEEGGLFDIGLDFSFVPSFTFDEQEEHYFRWQLSWGGPSDEFRIYTDNENNINRIEYWYMDWFDGASVECTQNQPIRDAVLWQLEGFAPAYELQACNDGIY
jgi:hypothetical protein